MKFFWAAAFAFASWRSTRAIDRRDYWAGVAKYCKERAA